MLERKIIYRTFERVFCFLILLQLSGCVNGRNFDALESSCETQLKANTTYAQLKELYKGETLQIQEDLVIEGYINSSDSTGNFFGVLYFQNNPDNPTDALFIEIDVRDSHLFYELGDKVLIKLKGLYLGYTRGNYKLGGVFTSFGSTSVGRLPYNAVFQHVLISCDSKNSITPILTSIPELKEEMINTLIRFENMEFSLEELGKPYAEKEEETERVLLDCDDNELIMLNSGYSDFRADLIPVLGGSITGVLTKEGEDYKLIVRDLSDIDFTQDKCEDLIDEFTSNQLFFSELADPENNVGARFMELYNSSTEPLSLKGWQILRYTNANTEVSSSIDLSGYTIDGESTLVISPNAEIFEQVYGFSPDIAVGTNSPADSNGDDNLQLVDPFGIVIDVFGIPGEDGSGTNHEFEDGKAIRRPEVNEGASEFQFSQWEIYNDTGEAGTLNQPQLAPDDFTPGIR